LLLSRFGIVKLKEVVLKKQGAPETLRMSDMSSGEQSVVMGLLGIGSQLQNGALICIDEPEVCLHPAWQERYIQLLSNIFSHYRGCHFIIATHSPQIVAQLPEDKCYVMDMEDGMARRSDEFSKRSIDYQLAALFNAPGFKNEYLSRIALNIFVKVVKEKKFDSEVIVDYKTLEKAYEFLRSDDPVRGIIESIREMYDAYGRH
jgi:ABC-type glutathione transport system ATPase component